DAVVHLGDRVERDPEHPLHEARGCFLELGDPVVRVAPVLGLADLLGQRAADGLGCRAVVLADPEVEQRALRVRRTSLTLRPLDLLELVDLGARAIGGAPDAVGETGLEVRIAHGRSLLHATGRAKQGWQPTLDAGRMKAMRRA